MLFYEFLSFEFAPFVQASGSQATYSDHLFTTGVHGLCDWPLRNQWLPIMSEGELIVCFNTDWWSRANVLSGDLFIFREAKAQSS